MVLVPSIMQLLGYVNWWMPKWSKARQHGRVLGPGVEELMRP
jgi:uncharacterized membrane protein YdfJ with MMPL/SSD domain